MRTFYPARRIGSGAAALLFVAMLGAPVQAQLFFNAQPQRQSTAQPQRVTAQPQRAIAQPQRPEQVLPQRSVSDIPVSTGLQGCANQSEAQAENRIASCTSV